MIFQILFYFPETNKELDRVLLEKARIFQERNQVIV